jgi:hypothetical protein
MQSQAAGRTTEIIDRTVSGGGNDPPRRVGRYAVDPPPVGCDREGFLHRIFSERDVAEDPDQRCYRLAVHLAERALKTGLSAGGGDGMGHA